MKKPTLLFLLLIGFVRLINAQEAKDLFTDNDYPYYWFGIDYSHVHLIGDFFSNSFDGEEPAKVIKEKYFKAWNDLMKNERSKFNVGSMLRKDSVEYNTHVIDSINKLTVVDEMVKEEATMLAVNDVEEILKKYKFVQKEGIGVVFIAETLNKSVPEASYLLVIFRLSDRKILINRRYVEAPVGFGIRNYWAGSIYKIFKKVTSIDYRAWKKIYK